MNRLIEIQKLKESRDLLKKNLIKEIYKLFDDDMCKIEICQDSLKVTVIFRLNNFGSNWEDRREYKIDLLPSPKTTVSVFKYIYDEDLDDIKKEIEIVDLIISKLK